MFAAPAHGKALLATLCQPQWRDATQRMQVRSAARVAYGGAHGLVAAVASVWWLPRLRRAAAPLPRRPRLTGASSSLTPTRSLAGLSICHAASDSQEPGVPDLSAAELLERVLAGLEKACSSVQGKIGGLQRQIRDPEEAVLWRRRGDGLLNVRQAWYPGMTEVGVPDYSNLGEDGLPLQLTVELDPKKDFKQNAQLCFKQAGKIDRGIAKCTPLLEEQERELKRWKAELQKIEGLRGTVAGEADEEESVFDQALPLYQELCEQRYIRKPKVKAAARASQEETEEQKWRRKYGKDVDRFVSPNGHEVLAGRSASANERVSFELTFKDALWFHTDNGIPGSHVTIRAPVGEVGDEDIEFAAAVAAWHSKAREKLYAPVMYCQGYQLRKPARRRTGQVQVSGNYQQIDVRPALPDS